MRMLVMAVLTAILITQTSVGRAADRITRAITGAQMAVVRNNVHPWAQPRYDRGVVADTLILNDITMMFKPSTGQQAALASMLEQLHEPSSSNYHQWLTPEAFGSLYGLSQNDTNKVVSWLASQGFSVKSVARSHLWVVFSGTASQVASAFHTEIHSYEVGGRSYYANVNNPLVPAALADVVLGFRGLNNFRLHSRTIVRHVSARPNPLFTSSITGEHFLAPSDVATIYDLNGLYNSGLTGAGQKIAVMGQTDIELSDVEAFRTASGLGANNPTVVLIPGSPDPGVQSQDIDEASLDVEWAGAVAPQATIVYVNSGTANGVFDSLQYAIDQDVAPIAVITYGLCEQQWDAGELQTVEAEAQQANAEGMTIIAPSGDSAAADCDESSNPNASVTVATQGPAVDAPASLPEVTGVGGTEFSEGSGTYWNTTNNSSNGSALSYIPEEAWNDTNATNGLEGSGGGASVNFSKPSWQTGSGVPNDNARDVPDLALAASPNHDGYLICSQGSCVNGFRASDQTLNVVGGTSVAAPLFAAILSLVNQETSSAQGNINYVLYPLAAADPAAFHDITTGNNDVPCQAGSTGCPSSLSFGFSAGPGYDQVTGLGSVDAGALVSDWSHISPTTGGSADFQLFVTPGSLTLAALGSGTAQITVTGLQGFSGAVSFTCAVPSSLPATCSLSPTQVSSGKSTVLTITSTKSTVGVPMTRPRSNNFGSWPLALISLAFAVAAMPVRRRNRSCSPVCRTRRPWPAAALGTAVLCLAALGTSCGSGTPPANNSSARPAPTVGNVTVTGTSGTLSHNVQVSVTLD